MTYTVINSDLKVKGKIYPEGSKISSTLLTKEDTEQLSSLLKPMKEPDTQKSANSKKQSNNKG